MIHWLELYERGLNNNLYSLKQQGWLRLYRMNFEIWISNVERGRMAKEVELFAINKAHVSF